MREDLILLLVFLLLILLYITYESSILPKNKTMNNSLEIDSPPKVLRHGYKIEKPYEEDDDSSEEDAEPEASLIQPNLYLGAGKIPSTVRQFGQVYDAQGESYYREGGCDVFMKNE